MSSKLFTYAAAAALAGAGFGVAQTVNAGSIEFEDAGWRASWDDSFDNADGTNVFLTQLNEVTTTSNALVLQKVAVFADGTDQYGLIAPIEINFQQIKPNAVPYIVIGREIVTNATGTDWGAFKFIIEGGTTGTAADPQFDLEKTFGGATPFDISPFTSWAATGITINPQTVTVTDGTVSNSTVWRPGFADGAGDLVISAAPSQTGTTRFVFKEQPVPTAIPLPAAAWTGLTSLAGLALLGGYKRMRHQVG